MNTKKFLLGTVVGGVAFFLIGWLLYGILLHDFMSQHGNPAASKSMEEMSLVSLFAGNLASAALLTYIFLTWANVSSFGAGTKAAAIVGFLMSVGIDLTMYGTTNMLDLSALCVDIVTSTVMTTLSGGIIGWVLGMGSKPTA